MGDSSLSLVNRKRDKSRTEATYPWHRRYTLRLQFADAFIIIWAILGAFVLRFGFESDISLSDRDFSYAVLSVILAALWWLMLGAWNSRERRILGAGADEYKRVAAASLWLFGIIAIVSYVLHIDTARGYVGVALPIGLVGLLLGRWLLRQHLSVDRHHGRSMSRLMLIGGPSAVAHLAASLHREKHAGYLPVAAYAPGERGELGVRD